ncbi:MAG TPA: class I adenylate-forming enzyme family protein [Steroidobacteraceae bacterium]|nr:class I adenylate-forming enzyme family protein [Steroidobacteraceae bacterium]
MTIQEAHAKLTAPGARFEMIDVISNGFPTRTWKNAPATLRDLFILSRSYQDRVFIIYEDERVTYEAFYRATVKLAHELRAQGVEKGDRVAIAMRNLPEWAVCLFAASICGAIATPLNAWWTGDELQYGLTNSGTKVAFVDGERYERLVNHLDTCPDLRRVYVARSAAVQNSKASLLETLIGAPNSWASLGEMPLPDAHIAGDDDATIFYTSGTTGRPKGALGSHLNMMTNALTGQCVQHRSFLRRGDTPPVVTPNDPQRVVLLSVPLFHVTGFNAWMVPAMFLGNRFILTRKWEVEKAMELIQRERVTQVGGVPAIAWQLIEHPARAQYDLSSLTLVTYGGAPSAPELVRRIRTVFPHAVAGNGWGMTEVSGGYMGINSEDYERRPDSCGPAPAVGEIKIMNAEGTQELGRGEVGELWVKGPQVIKGYWKSPDATAQTFINGWVRTGDVARLDDEGFCFLVDRAKDMLIRGGENIYCIQVESVLYEHPAIMDATVVGIPHRILGEEPGAVVHLKPDSTATADEIRAFCATKLASFQVPVQVKFWMEPLPRNPAGKILKKELKALFTPSNG